MATTSKADTVTFRRVELDISASTTLSTNNDSFCKQ